MCIGERIHALLKEKGATQKDLSDFLNAATSTVNNWIKGGKEMTAAYIMPICRFLDVTPEYLLEGEGNPHGNKDAAPALTNDEQYLLSLFRDLDREGVHVVMNCAIEERRRVVAEGIGVSSTAESS